MSLTPSQESRARRLHEESIILLAHDHFSPPQDVDALRAGKITGKILMTVLDARAWSPDAEDYRRSTTELDGWFTTAQEKYRQVLHEIDLSSDLMVLRNSQDVLTAKQHGKIGVLLGAEGGKLIEDRIENLHALYAMGLRHILLTWAFNNRISAGEQDNSGAGLTELGRQVIQEMNRLGIIIDITHISRPALREVLELSTRPVLNSHTSLKSIANRVPAMTEAEIRAVADKGGVIALHFMTHMLTGRFSPQATIENVLEQIEAIVQVGGIDCIALGPDYLPYTEEFKRNTSQWQLSFPVGLESPAGILSLIRGLVEGGYSDEAIEKILGQNLLRFFRETLDSAESAQSTAAPI